MLVQYGGIVTRKFGIKWVDKLPQKTTAKLKMMFGVLVQFLRAKQECDRKTVKTA